MSHVERLLVLDMLPVAYNRKIKDLLFLYIAVFGYIDIDVSNYVTFNNHLHTRCHVTSLLVVILLFRPVRPARCKLHILSIL